MFGCGFMSLKLLHNAPLGVRNDPCANDHPVCGVVELISMKEETDTSTDMHSSRKKGGIEA